MQTCRLPHFLAAAIFVGMSSASGDDFDTVVGPFLEQHCVQCHGDEVRKSGLRLDRLDGAIRTRAIADLWQDVRDRVADEEMPPEDEPQPSAEARAQLIAWIDAALAQADDPQPRALRRLNRTEYANTIRDLMGVEFPAQDRFPPDPTAHGFDNVASALTSSPLQMEKYLEAAREIVDRAMVSGPRPDVYRRRYELEKSGMVKSETNQGNDGLVNFNSNEVREGQVVIRSGEANREVEVHFFNQWPPGEYRVRVKAAGIVPEGHGYGPSRLRVVWQGKSILETDVTTAQIYEGRLSRETASDTQLDLFNSYHIPPLLSKKEAMQKPEFPRPELLLDWIEIEGPLHSAWPPESHRRIFFESPNREDEAVYAREVLDRFLTEAYRRPLRDGEMESMLALFQDARDGGRSFQEAMKIPLIATLASPKFLFLADAQREFSAHDLALRLSYFLWSTMPDETLQEAAASGKLLQPERLTAEVDRLLDDPRSEAFVKNFTGQWLGIRKIGQVVPDKARFRRYDDHLEQSMMRESEAFFREILTHDLSVMTFIDSDFLMLNERMARYYGVPDIVGDHFRNVPLTDDTLRRGGLLSQASFLTLTSNGTRTSPVIRGVWVRENLLGDPPSPPPPNVGEITPEVPGIDKATVRQRLELHRKIRECAACHARIDPYGLALENYNAVGRWRDREGFGYLGMIENDDPPIDATSILPDGSQLDGVESLKAHLLAREDEFATCLIEKLMIYGLGRELDLADEEAIEHLLADAKRNGLGMRSLVHSLVRSDVFRSH